MELQSTVMRTVRLAAVAFVILIAPPARGQSAARPDVDPRVSTLVASISEARMEQLLRTLVAFGTRNTLSDTTSPTRGIGAARQWIFDELKRTSPRLQVSFDTHQIPKARRITRDIELRNVMAVLPGRSPRRIYVSGHYDSVNLGARGQLAGNTRPPTEGVQARGAQAPGGQRGEVQRPGAQAQAPGEPAAPPN